MTRRLSPNRHVAGPSVANAPRPAAVLTRQGAPIEVDGEIVEEQLESWLVEDRWWTEQPLRRRYWELVTSTGRCAVVFHDLETGAWFAQAA